MSGNYSSYGEKEGFLLAFFVLVVAILRSLIKKIFHSFGEVKERGDNPKRLFYVRSRLRKRHLDLGKENNIVKRPSIRQYLKGLFRL